MSNAEAGSVIDLISDMISNIEVIKNVYDAAKDAKGQPETFRQIATRLPPVIEILRSTKERALDLDKEGLNTLECTLKSCRTKADNLKEIFQKVIRKDDDTLYDRCKKTDIQVLPSEKAKMATSAKFKEFQEATKEMKEMSSPLPDEAGGVVQTHTGSGDNIGHSGLGTFNFNKPARDIITEQYNISNLTFDRKDSDSTSGRPKRTRIAACTDDIDSSNTSYDDDNGGSATSADSTDTEGFVREAYDRNRRDSSEVVINDEEDSNKESGEEESDEESGEEGYDAESSEEDSIEDDSTYEDF